MAKLDNFLGMGHVKKTTKRKTTKLTDLNTYQRKILKYLTNSELWPSGSALGRAVTEKFGGTMKGQTATKHFKLIEGSIVRALTVRLEPSVRGQIAIRFYRARVAQPKGQYRQVFEAAMQKIPVVSGIYEEADADWDYIVKVSTRHGEQDIFRKAMQDFAGKPHSILSDFETLATVGEAIDAKNHEIDCFLEEYDVEKIVEEADRALRL